MILKHIVFSPRDNVAVLLQKGEPGDVLEHQGKRLILSSGAPGGFKVALSPIPPGGSVLKYGEPIGAARVQISPGEIVHSHNLGSALSEELHVPAWKKPLSPCRKEDFTETFRGFRRASGRVGIRNELWIIPTVGCLNGLLREMGKTYSPPEWISAVRVLEHPWGCSQLGEDLEDTRRVLAGLAHNPNAAGVLVAGMGCENLQLDSMMPLLSDVPNLAALVLQQEENEEEAVRGALEALAAKAEREPADCPLSDLAVAVKCGGSDAFSSITANPLLGRFTDRITCAGGTVLMGEIPEMFGAEKGLFARCASSEVHDKLAAALRSFREYFIRHNQPVFENPSPGNKAGGISTLEEKSLGAVSKSGESIITDVLEYGEVFSRHGLNVVFSPGNDLVSCTAMAAAGAVLILFSTGRGTPFGTVVPTLKIATNRELAVRKPNWIDFDASGVITGGMEKSAEKLLAGVLEVAAGKEARNEQNHIAEISIFKNGVIL